MHFSFFCFVAFVAHGSGKQLADQLNMKLVRLRGDRRFYYIMLGDELFDFSMVVPQSLRLVTPLDANEYLPVMATMMQRPGGLGVQLERLRRAGPGDFRAFRRPLEPDEISAPVQPLSFRAYDTFADHARRIRQRFGAELPPEWHACPVFCFGNTAGIVGPNAVVRLPTGSAELDYELEIAAVIGREGRDIAVEEADSYIVGFTILNDWSLRDLERGELKVGRGPAKSKDFSTSIGPCLVTVDELEEHALLERSRGRRYDLTLMAAVNGHETSRGNARDMRWTFAELIAHASRDTVLVPGDLIGAVAAGSLVDLPAGTHPWLQPGDTVRLEIEALGVLQNSIIA